MQEISNTAINYHVYNLHEGEQLIQQVSKVMCVLMPRGLIIVGFSQQGDLLMIRYGDYDRNLPLWILDFFENRFAEEPMLARPDQIFAVYIASDKYMVVPNALYHKKSAEDWIKTLFYVEDNEDISDYYLQQAEAHYLYSLPGPIRGLANRYFAKAKFLPLAAYHFESRYRSDDSILCSVTLQQVHATMYKNQKLKWHQVFNYETAEDIAYQLKLMGQQYQVETGDMELQCFIAYQGLNFILNNLVQYFPHTKASDPGAMTSNPQWASPVSLYQRLYTCAL